MIRLLEQTKYIALVGVIFLLVASLAAFGWGASKAVAAISEIVHSAGKDAHIAVSLIEVVDAFLVAIALYVFAVSIYEMFTTAAISAVLIALNVYGKKD